MNEFIDYLNSTNNAGSDSTGSLAEKQVKSPFYDEVKVNRKIGAYITQCIADRNPTAFIITGHAGDGKTSILVQVLKDAGLLQINAGLEAEYACDSLYYVKDMSEIPPERQSEVLEKALGAPIEGKCSILISNTGPLISAFSVFIKQKRMEKGLSFSDEDSLALQSRLLTQMDQNSEELLSEEGYRFHLLNIARADNVVFAKKILRNIVAAHLWEKCSDCRFNNRCPILHNRILVADHFDRVSEFIENYYRFLIENDKRMTIRQMVGQISYAITGNLNCNKVANIKDPYFRYNIANLFFGYVGQTENSIAEQIKGIRQIRMLGLDRIALDVDYGLFVNNDFSRYFPNDICSDINGFWEKNRALLSHSPDEEDGSEVVQKDLSTRRAIRRFYLFFGLPSDNFSSTDGVFDQIFGTYFAEYKRIISSHQNQLTIKKMQDVVFRALYVKNTGFFPADTDRLPLTLRRKDDVFQSVMLILGRVDKKDLKILQRKKMNKFDDMDDRYDLVLSVGGTEFTLSLPLLSYFDSLNRGAVSSNNNPALTHGIARLDALLHSKFGSSDSPCELSLLVNTVGGQPIMNLTFEDNTLRVD